MAFTSTLLALAMAVLQASCEWTTGTWITGYWDCCKPSCSWKDKGRVDKPVASCHKDTGLKLDDADASSVCQGGVAASCVDNQPFLVNDGLSMGFAAAATGGVHGLTGDANCGQCFELRFEDRQHYSGGWPWGGAHPDLVNKTHIVQVTNIGYDVTGEHSFDLQIPAAGQGAFTSGCTAQFPGYGSSSFDCNNNYGGCLDISGCAALPSELQRGCEWRFTWFKWLMSNGRTNNPYVRFRRIKCPTELTSISSSIPTDDDNYPAISPDDYASGSVTTTTPAATTTQETMPASTTTPKTTTPTATTTLAATTPATTTVHVASTSTGATSRTTTDASTTNFSVSTTVIGECRSWCAKNFNAWSKKCNWSKCAGCADCADITTTPLSSECRTWCPKNANSWERKCSWEKCRGCTECTTTTLV